MRSGVLWILIVCAAAPPAEAGVKIDHWTAESGARVNFVERHALPIVDVAVEFAAGSAYDSREQAGLARLTLAMLKAGSSRYSETEASRRIAEAGAQLQENFDLDRAGFALRSLSSEAERKAATQTLADMLQAPLFPAEAFERERASAIANAREAETQPDRIAERRLYALMYPAHPYGFSETPDTLASIRREDVERHYRSCYGAARAVVTIVGDVDRDAARALAEELTSSLSKKTGPVLAPVAAPPAVVGEFVKHGPTEAELKAAKKSLVGGFPLRIDTNRKILEQTAMIGFYRLPLAWLEEFPARVEAVTLAQVRSAFARRIDPEKLSIVVVGAPD